VLYPTPNPKIAWRLKIPAFALVILSALQLAPLFIFLLRLIVDLMSWVHSGFRRFHCEFSALNGLGAYDHVANATCLVLMFTVTLITLCGAWQMLSVKSHRLCKVAAFLAGILGLSPLLFVGIPFGLWAAVALNVPSTAEEFRRVATPVGQGDE
jgi:hypothetical protein